MTEAAALVTNPAFCQELDHRLGSLQTSIAATEWAIIWHEDTLESCQMQEEEEALQDDAEGNTNTKMQEGEEGGDGEPSGPQEVAETEDAPPPAPTGDAVSAEEDAFLMQQAPQPVDPNEGSHSPRSEAGTVSGEMAELSLVSPSLPPLEDNETQQ